MSQFSIGEANLLVLSRTLHSPLKKMLIYNVKEAAVVASIPLFLSGMDSSFAADLENLIENRSITLIEASIIGSINLYARAVGSLVAGCIVNKIGRKNLILVSLFLNTLAWIIISYFSFRIEIIYVGRLCSGLGCGVRAIVILYISEVVHPTRRGKFLTFPSFSSSIGTSFTYLVQYFLSPKMVSVFALMISIFGLIQACFLYETKYWLLMKNRFEEAQCSMLWFDNTMTEKYAFVEIEEIQSQRNEAVQKRKHSFCKQSLFVKHLLICVLIFSCRTAAGRMPISVYPHNYYRLFLLPISAEIATLTQGALDICFSLANLCVADSFPRKSILQVVCWTMISCLVVSYFQLALVEMLGFFGECLILSSLMLYIGLACGFLLSLTTITVSEIASTVTEARGIILSTCASCHNIISAIYTSFFPIVLVTIPVNYVLLFMSTNLVLVSLLLTLVPETVGKALHKCDWAEEKDEKDSLVETDEENLLK